MPSSLTRSVAIHEAGHAVAAHLLRMPFNYIAIEEDDDSLGHVLLKPFAFTDDFFFDLTDSKRDRIERGVIIGLAGREAEKLVIGRYYGARSKNDLNQVMNILNRMGHSELGLRHYYRWLRDRSYWMVAKPEQREWVEAIADRLMKDRRLRAADVRAVIDDTIIVQELRVLDYTHPVEP